MVGWRVPFAPVEGRAGQGAAPLSGRCRRADTVRRVFRKVWSGASSAAGVGVPTPVRTSGLADTATPWCRHADTTNSEELKSDDCRNAEFVSALARRADSFNSSRRLQKPPTITTEAELLARPRGGKGRAVDRITVHPRCALVRGSIGSSRSRRGTRRVG